MNLFLRRSFPLSVGHVAPRVNHADPRPSRANLHLCLGLTAFTLAFTGAPAAPRLYTVGDSTVQRYSSSYYPRAGWGQVLGHFFDPDQITVVNRAVGGTSTKTFYENGHWANLLADLQAGDFVTIQFGINDSASDARHTNPSTTFKDYLSLFVNDVRALGAFPILVSTQNRNAWNNTDPPTVFSTYHAYAEATRQLAAQLDVPLIDLDQRSRAFMESVGKTYSTYFLFHHYPPGEWPNFPNGAADDVHFQEMGAIEMARLVAAGIRDLAGDPDVAPLISFLEPTYPVTFNLNVPDAGLVSRSAEFPAGITVTAYAWPRSGYTFTEWTGAISSTERHYTFTMGTAAKTITAHFAGNGSNTTTVLHPAETAHLGGGVKKDSNYARFHGSGFIDFPTAGGYAEFTGVDGGAGGGSILEIRHALGRPGTRTGLLTVNGVSQPITFTSTNSFAVWQSISVPISLQSGILNTIRLSSNGQDLSNVDEIIVTAPTANSPDDPPPPDDPDDPNDPDDPPPPDTGSTRQAEDATYGGGVKKEYHYKGYNGSGFLNFPSNGGHLEFSGIDGGAGGEITLAIRYALGVSNARTGTLLVNGVAQSITFTPTPSFAKWQTHTVTISLNSGPTNTLRFESNGNDLSNIDEVTVGPSSTPPDEPPPDDPPPSGTLTYPAENADPAGGVTIVNNYENFHGTGLAAFPLNGGTLTFNHIAGNGGGPKTLAIRYANGSAYTRTGALTVNATTTSISFPKTGSWNTWAILNTTVTLNATNANTLQFASTGKDLANIDEITVP